MTPSELMQAMADAGAPLEAIILAVRALDERDAEIRARDTVAADKRAADAERKRLARASADIPRTKRGRVHPPPNDIYSNPPEPVEANASTPPIETRLVEKWNAGPAANGARKATRLDASRKSLLKARLRDHTEAEVLEAVANLGASRFHCGENDRGWRANLGWMLEAKNFLKALEMGGGEPSATTGQFDTPEARAAFLAKIAESPWSRPPDRPPDRPAAFNQPPRSIGQLAKQITQDQAA